MKLGLAGFQEQKPASASSFFSAHGGR